MDAAVSRHPVDSRPPSGRLAALGIQHVLIMYAGCVTVPLIFGAAAAAPGRLGDGHNLTIASVSLGVGLLPEVADGIYDGFPSWAQIITGSGITSAAVTAFALNLLFHYTTLGAAAAPQDDFDVAEYRKRLPQD
jgi:xanthine/uracil permease